MKSRSLIPLIPLGLLLILTWSSAVSAGHISYWDFNIDYTNFDYGRNYTFKFALDTNLSPTDYLKIVMPFGLHTGSTNGVPNTLRASYYGGCVDSSASLAAGINVLADGGVYFVSFKNAANAGGWLSNGTVYTLTLQATANPPTQTAGNFGPIELYAVSSTDPLAIVYDSNPNFATFTLTAAPTSNIEVQYDIPGANKNGLLESYQVFFHLIPKSVLPTHNRVHIFFDGAGFNFSSYCKSVTKLGDSLSYYALSDDVFTCTVDTHQNRLVLDIRTEFSLARPLRIETIVTNPNRVVLNRGIEVRVLKGFDNQILERQTITNIFFVNTQTIINGNLKLGWLMDYDSVVFPKDKTVSISRSVDNNNRVFNSLRYYFQVAVDTPNGVELRLELNLATSATTNSLQHGSLVENLRPHPGKTINCYISNNDNVAATRKVICLNVGRLFAGTSYFIGFKMTVSAGETLAASFGKIAVYTLTGTTVDSNALIPEGDPLVAISKITLNNNLAIAKANAKNTIVSSKATSSALVTAPENENNLLGLNYNVGVDQKLIFGTSFTNADAFLGGASATTNGVGAYCVVNTKFEFTSTLTIEHSTPADASSGTASYELINSPKGSYGRLKIWHTDQTNLAKFWVGASPYFSINSFRLGVHGSLYPDADTLDFFCYTFNDINSVQPTEKVPFFFNSYTITNPKPNTLQYAMVNYWNDNSNSNDGNFLPSILRIAGYMSATEGNSGQARFSIFFDGNIDFYPSSSAAGDYSIGCGSSVAGVTCYGFPQTNTIPGQVNLFYRRVDIDYGGNAPIGTNNIFQLLIPVKTVSGIGNRQINILLATATQNSEFIDLNKPVFTLRNIFRLTNFDADAPAGLSDRINFVASENSVPVSGTLADGFKDSSLTINDYGLDLTGTKVGFSKESLIVKAGHTESSALINVNTRQSTNSWNGAGFTFNVEWNFETSSTNYAWSNAGSDPAGRCLKFFYNKDAASDLRYGVFCPILIGSISSATKLTINNFLMPNVNGLALPSKVSLGYSDYLGRLVSLKVLSTLEAAGPAPLYLQSQTSLRPSLIPKNKKGIKVLWEFTTTNPISNGMVITVTFSSDSGMTWGSVCKLSHTTASLNKDSSCSATGSASSVVFTISACTTCPMSAGKFVIEHYGNNAHTTDKQTTSFSMKTVNAAGKIVDESPADGQITYDNTQTQDAMEVSSSLGFTIRTKRAWTTVSLNFSAPGRPIWAGEKLIVNFGSMAIDNNANTNVFCKVYLTSNNSMSYSWQSVSVSSFTAVTVVAKSNVLEFGTKFTLVCDNMKVPATNIAEKVSSNIQDSAGNDMLIKGITDVTGLSDQAPLTVSDALKVSKVFNTVGVQGEVLIDYKPEHELQTNSTITVVMPYYYSPRLSNGQNIFCQVNSTRVTCSFDRERTIIFSGLPSAVSKSQPIQLRIAGVDIPRYSTARNFYVAADNDTDPSSVISYGESVDKLPDAGLPLNIQVVNSTVNNTFLNSEGTHNITVILPAYQVLENNTFFVYFGNQYKDMLDRRTPICSMFKRGNNSFNYVRECSSFGNRVKIILGQNETLIVAGTTNTPLPASTTYQYTILLEKVPTPDEAYCNANEITLAIGNYLGFKDVREDSMKYKSNYITNNQNPVFSFFKNPSLVSVLYNYEKNLNGEYEIINGLYSKPLRFVLGGGARFNSPLIISPKIKNLVSNPDVLRINSGDSELAVSFVTNPTVFQNGFYYLEFETLFDPNNRYERLPLLPVRVISRKIKIDLTVSQYYMPPDGVSAPITFDLNNFLPYDSVTIAAAVPANEFTIDVGQQGLTFSRSSPTNAFRFRSTGNAKIGTNYQINFTISGPNSELYEAPSPIRIQIQPPSTNSPIYSATVPSVTENSTFTNVDLTCDQAGGIFLFLALRTATVPSAQEIEFRSLTQSQPYNFLSEDQAQYLYVPVFRDDAGKKRTIRLNNLLSQQQYRVTSFCKNQGDISSLLVQSDFETKWNGGYLQRLNFQFADSFTNRDPANLTRGLEAFLCRVSTLAMIPPESVTTASGQYCLNYTVPGRSRNFTLQYQFPDSNILQLYFHPIQSSEKDLVTTQINSIANNLTLFLFNLKQNSTALLPQLERIIGPTTPSGVVPNYHPTTPVDIFTRNDTIQVTNVSLDSPGFVYAAVDLSSNAAPTFMQLKQGLSGNNTRMAVDPQMRYYVNNGFTFNFKGLRNKTEYRIIWVGSAEDPLTLTKFREFKVQVLNTTESGDLVITAPNNLGNTSYSSKLFAGLMSLALIAIVCVLF